MKKLVNQTIKAIIFSLLFLFTNSSWSSVLTVNPSIPQNNFKIFFKEDRIVNGHQVIRISGIDLSTRKEYEGGISINYTQNKAQFLPVVEVKTYRAVEVSPSISIPEGNADPGVALRFYKEASDQIKNGNFKDSFSYSDRILQTNELKRIPKEKIAPKTSKDKTQIPSDSGRAFSNGLRSDVSLDSPKDKLNDVDLKNRHNSEFDYKTAPGGYNFEYRHNELRDSNLRNVEQGYERKNAEEKAMQLAMDQLDRNLATALEYYKNNTKVIHLKNVDDVIKSFDTRDGNRSSVQTTLSKDLLNGSFRSLTLTEDGLQHYHKKLEEAINSKSWVEVARVATLLGNAGFAPTREDIFDKHGILKGPGFLPDIYKIEGRPAFTSQLREVANNIQAAALSRPFVTNIRQGNEALLIAVMSSLGAMGTEFSGGFVKADAMLKISQAYSDFMLGVSRGILVGAYEMGSGIVHLAAMVGEKVYSVIENPQIVADAFESVSDIILDEDKQKLVMRGAYQLFAETIPSIIDQTKQEVLRKMAGTASDRGELLGRSVFEVVSLFVGFGELKVFSQPAKQAVAIATTTAESLNLGQKTIQGLNKALYPLKKETQLFIENIQTASPYLKGVFRSTIDKDVYAALDAAKAYKISSEIGSFSNFANEAEKASLVVLQQKANTRNFLMGILDSQKIPEQRFLGLNKVDDLPVLAREYNKVDQAIMDWQKISSMEQPKIIQGYRARYYPETFVDSSGNVIANSAQNAFQPHAGTIVTRNRLGFGGPSGQPVVSSGFGQTAEEAARVASVEVRSYGVDPSKLKLSIEPIQIDGSKVLDFRDPKTREFFLDQMDLNKLQLDKNLPSAYTLPNMIGHAAKQQGFDGIILNSVPDSNIGGHGVNFHNL